MSCADLDRLLYDNSRTCVWGGGYRYHRTYPDYIYSRIEEVKSVRCRLCVLLVLVDVVDAVKHLSDIIHIATFHQLSLVCAWSVKVLVKDLKDVTWVVVLYRNVHDT